MTQPDYYPQEDMRRLRRAVALRILTIPNRAHVEAVMLARLIGEGFVSDTPDRRALVAKMAAPRLNVTPRKKEMER